MSDRRISWIGSSLQPHEVRTTKHQHNGSTLERFATQPVIAGTLLVEGGFLPAVVSLLGLRKDAEQEIHEDREAGRSARLAAIEAALLSISHIDNRAAAELRMEYEHRREDLLFPQSDRKSEVPAASQPSFNAIALKAISAERKRILQAFRKHSMPEYILHQIQRDIDLRELRLLDFQD